jgi:hypothetical protein
MKQYVIKTQHLVIPASRVISDVIENAATALSTTEDPDPIRLLEEVGTKIFGFLAPKRDQPQPELSPSKLRNAHEMTLNCVACVHKHSGREDIPWYPEAFERIHRGLLNEFKQRWKRSRLALSGKRREQTSLRTQPTVSHVGSQVRIHPTEPDRPPATWTRAPQTTTRRLVEEYLFKVEAETNEKVSKTDFWLRPTKLDGTSRYHSDREFRAFQKEDPNQPPGTRKQFLDVLKMDTGRFVHQSADRRRRYKERRKSRIPR